MSAPAVAAAPVEAPVVVPVAAPVDAEPANADDALAIVLKKSIEVNGLIRGLSQVARALDARTAHLCILAEDCEDPQYTRLIRALCAQHNIDLVSVAKREKLAQWAGLVKRDPTGAVKKTFKCSCVAIKDFGEKTRALEMLMDQMK